MTDCLWCATGEPHDECRAIDMGLIARKLVTAHVEAVCMQARLTAGAMLVGVGKGKKRNGTAH